MNDMDPQTDHSNRTPLWLTLLQFVALAALAFAMWQAWRQVNAGARPAGNGSWMALSQLAMLLGAVILPMLLSRTYRAGGSDYLVLFMMAAAGIAALYIAPTERTMGVIQRIFYMHLPSAASGFVALITSFIASIVYLRRRQPKWDWLAVSSAEVGIVCFTCMLVTGPIWAHPVWGIWWTWDAKLTSTFILWVLYIAYLLLRTLIAEPERRAVVSAVFGIFAFLDVPLVYLSNRLWRTQHPAPVIAGGPNSGLDPLMWYVFLTCLCALLGLMIILVRQRYRLEATRHAVEEMNLEAQLREARSGAR